LIKEQQKLQDIIDTLQNDKIKARQLSDKLEADMKTKEIVMDNDRDVLKQEILKYQTLIEVMQKSSDASEQR